MSAVSAAIETCNSLELDQHAKMLLSMTGQHFGKRHDWNDLFMYLVEVGYCARYQKIAQGHEDDYRM